MSLLTIDSVYIYTYTRTYTYTYTYTYTSHTVHNILIHQHHLSKWACSSIYMTLYICIHIHVHIHIHIHHILYIIYIYIYIYITYTYTYTSHLSKWACSSKRMRREASRRGESSPSNRTWKKEKKKMQVEDQTMREQSLGNSH